MLGDRKLELCERCFRTGAQGPIPGINRHRGILHLQQVLDSAALASHIVSPPLCTVTLMAPFNAHRPVANSRGGDRVRAG
jgi:hypothetical protein